MQAGDRATTTDAQGRFKVDVAVGDSLTISHVGYETVRLLPTAESLVVRLHSKVLKTPEIIVEGGLAEETLSEAAASITVMDKEPPARD